jgi:hypothetical protein
MRLLLYSLISLLKNHNFDGTVNALLYLQNYSLAVQGKRYSETTKIEVLYFTMATTVIH